MKKLSIIIPVYNEEETVSELIKRVKKANLDIKKELIVIDDGSKDNTLRILKKIKGIKLIKHEKNKGKGAAIRTGIKHSTGDIIVIQDADLEYDPEEYNKLIKPILKGETKVVYGSRFLSAFQKKRNVDFLRGVKEGQYLLGYIAGRFLTTITNVLYRTKITDEATCYKVFDANVLKKIPLKCNRFEFCPEVTAKVAKRNYKIKEIPISYKPRKFEDGKKINWKDGIHAVWTLLKYRFID